jgi:aminoglycoside phosphotransferase (APT) family kinase protein
MEEFQLKLSRFVHRLHIDGAITNLTRLSGGANMESWSFDCGEKGYVLRRAGSAELMAGRAFGHDVEAALVRAAFAAGVKAPEIVGELEADDGLGTGYLMRRIEAEVSPAKILVAPPPSLLDDLARELALIHAMPVIELPSLPQADAGSLLADLKQRFLDFGGDRPVMALAFRWLEDRLPPPVLLHGDFRLGNLMVDAGGLAAVLDWELAHLGDRHQDLAYGCINSWRFGQIDRPAFGIGQFEALWRAYEPESGVAVEPDRFRWWLVYSTLWWGICCLQMADIWRSGKDSGLERAVIGRRASETEVDLLLLLEEDAPEEERRRSAGRVTDRALAKAGAVENNDSATRPALLPSREHGTSGFGGEPSSADLLHALAQWIEADIKPRTTGRDRFMASVALNALGMLTREANAPVDIHDRALSAELLAGRKGLATPGLLADLKARSLAKLAVDQPRYSAYEKARKLWLRSEN